MTVRRNRVINPVFGADTSTYTASSSSSAPTFARVAAAGPLPAVTTLGRLTVVSTPTWVELRSDSPATNAVTGGEIVTFSTYVVGVTAASAQWSATITWLDAAGSVMPTPVTATAAFTTGVWGRASVSGTAPAGAARARLAFRLTATAGTLAATDTVSTTGWLFESAPSVGAFFDGDTGPWYSWEGVANASTSVWYSPSLVLTPTLDNDPCPRVEVLITDIPLGAATVTVHRLAAGRDFEVRGAVKTPVTGALTRIDFEVPFGVDATYRAELFNSSGLSIGFSDTATTFVDVEETWVHNPLDPQGATTVMFRDNAARSIQRPTEGEPQWPMGRTVAVIVSGQRRGIQDVTLDVVVDSIDQADRLQAMAGSYGSRTVPVICFRIGSQDRVRLPRPLFAGVLNLDEQDMTYVLGGETIAFGITGSEAAPPTPALVVPLLTRADLNAYYHDRAELNADNLTRLAVNRRYDLAGNG